ncbi:alanyl-tRNA editing protein [Candidatus Methanomethylophilus sp. 1R26]|jgi:alanyl-tRNA synthetase|uniref:alanyl-tRNA editing protein n=1 Tax=Candidatus Methanomethylophilus sp. 1R26 TaxID=1769296 RepID=UPI000736A0EA|nr:DHHA1 domain-containing protein [Candidatus Methanomethylophilus sp. 1R26]MCH3978319.1 DHHA1 domain-containing protein [Methanomethylophilus sp.]WII08867.1 DHHA1 domain-containing protein [Methanomassiliicoccales archaeon LGM-DZ1]KUE73377.1 alanyl-tRNA editing protein [Candidatus Methanomethylophilus sp. 1R26]MCI2075441.1 DHHA1 domain-containing protein [Methanomethylophilus sp.]MCI2093263.1 DHHA1 domain-containing protein [Methanomethylophilus sp.]
MADEVFRHDGYLSEFESEVTAVDGDKVVMNLTAFYPGGGGQVCDTGTINGKRVTEVRYEGKEIVHIVPGNDFRPGMRVWCSLDWDRRFDLMMGHTGEHLLFCSLHREDPDLAITKIYISPEDKYVIVNHDVSWEKIRSALAFANKAIRDNLTVRKTVMARNDPDLAKVRIKLDRIPEDEEITVVSIGDIDYSACSGVHVQETSELGMLFVDRKVSAGRDGVAIHFKVGDAAADAAISLAATCLEVIDETGSKPELVVKTVANMKHNLEAAAEASKEAAKKGVGSLEPETVGGTAFYSGVFPGADRKVLAEAVEKLKAEGAVCAFIAVGETANIMLGSGSPKVDCRKVLPKVLGMFGGRGGGKPDFAQGGIPDASKAAEALEALKKEVAGLLEN